MNSPSKTLHSKTEFQRELAELLREAQRGDVDLQGGWDFRDGVEPKLGIEIYEVV